MMNTKKITMKVWTTLVAGSILLLMNSSMAYGQDAAERRDDAGSAEVAYTAEDLRDPFEPYVQPTKAPVIENMPIEGDESVPLPKLTISGITWGSKYSQAIVNGKVVKEGDTIEGVKIVSITKNGLVILFHNQQGIIQAPGPGRSVEKK